MTRRLSVTVPDDLWDAVAHLDNSQSGLVQKGLRSLRESIEIQAGRSPIEIGSRTDPMYERVLSELTEQSTDLRTEGYEAVVFAISRTVITLDWLESVVRNYSFAELPGMLARAADVFLSCRNDDPEGSGMWIERPVTLDEVESVIARAGHPWDEDDRLLLGGLGNIVAVQPDTDLGYQLNGARVFQLGPGALPVARVSQSTWEGMAAAVYDIVAAVRRRVLTENHTTGADKEPTT